MLLKNKSRYVASGGVYTALSVVFMVLSSISPVCRLAFVFMASAVVGIAHVSCGRALAWMVWAATSLLSLFLVADKAYAVLYLIVVGNYPIIKLYIEKIRRLSVRTLVKLFCFNVYMLICYGIGTAMLNINISGEYPLWIIWIFMLVAFFVYDYAYSVFMQKIYYVIPKINNKEKNYENRN